MKWTSGSNIPPCTLLTGHAVSDRHRSSPSRPFLLLSSAILKFFADNRCILVPRLRFPGWEFLSGYQFEFWIIISEQWAVIELFHLWISCEFPRYQNDTKRKTFHRFVFYLWRTVSKTKQKCALGFLSSKLVQNMPTTFPVRNKFAIYSRCTVNETSNWGQIPSSHDMASW